MPFTDEQLARKLAQEEEREQNRTQGDPEDIVRMNSRVMDQKEVDAEDSVKPESDESSSEPENITTPNIKSSSAVEAAILRKKLAEEQEKRKSVE